MTDKPKTPAVCHVQVEISNLNRENITRRVEEAQRKLIFLFSILSGTSTIIDLV